MNILDRVAQVDYLRQLVADTYSNSAATLEDYSGDVEGMARDMVDYILTADDLPGWMGAHDLALLLRWATEIILEGGER